jgi:hypothetical protein
MLQNSILETIKKPLNVSADDTTFDDDIVLFVNSELATLRQLGVDGLTSLMITGSSETWGDLFGEETEKLQMIKNLIYAGARIKFDPPDSVPTLNALKDIRTELSWRIVES